MTARVRITADDAGALPAIDQAILELLAAGTLTRAAAFSNGPRFSRFADQAASFSVVPHLTLTYGCPLSDPRPLRSLLAANGNFLQPLDYYEGDVLAAIKAWTTRAFHACDPVTATGEIRRQVDHFRAVTGREIDAITFHHDIDEHIIEALQALAPECYRTGRAGLTRAGKDAGTYYGFLPATCGLEAAIAAVVSVLQTAIDASRCRGGLPAEAVFHPSIDEADLNGFTAYSDGRVREYQALTSPQVLTLISRAARHADLLVFD